ncbi:alpha/beta fold hydrolase [Sinisalibacter lacisalsi]|uniref:Esterase n=1 Tax=Sinisalibacter lacisalsi TaxID=1526570 RepID=A0ABQ1QGV1_9RHOB|nr:alpha/beta fold hydrolase [Sinisalibacter lacisalsi]GGD26195.1 esterase [Sinisalibacter lacisalsi]
MLAMQSHGSDDARPPILIVHGLFGSGRNWGVIAKRLAETRRVVTVDLRNHGDSFHAESQAYDEMAEDLAATIDRIGGTADVIGHSMGGKAAMTLALASPDHLRRLLIADIAPVAYSHGEGHHALIAAMQGLDLSGITTRAEADSALEADIPNPAVRAFLLQSLDVKERRWKLNLPVLARELDRVMGFPEVDGAFEGPVLFLSGADSDYVLPEHRPTIKTLFPKARQAKIPEAGHWLHAERPRAFEAAARAFLDG